MRKARSLWAAAVYMLLIISLPNFGFAVCTAPISVTPAGPFPFGGNGGSTTLNVNTGGSGGLSCHWGANSSSFISVSPAGGGGGSTFVFQVTMTVFANPNFASRTGSVTFTQTEDGTSQTITVNQGANTGNFSLSITPASQTVTAGDATSYTVTIARSGGFTGAVNLAASSVPAGPTATFTPNNTTGSTSTMNVSTSGSPTGTFTLTVTGTNGNASRTATTSLTINPAPTPTPTPPLTSFVMPDTSSHTVFIDANSHLIDLFLNSSGVWQKQDLSTSPGTTLALANGGLASIINAGGCPHVFYIGTDSHLDSRVSK